MRALLLDNAEWTRHVRCATRRGRSGWACAAAAMAAVLCLMVNVACYQRYRAYATTQECFRSIFFQITGVTYLLVIVGGAIAAGSSMARERLLKTLPYQRLTGASPLAMAVGKIMGPSVLMWKAGVAAMPVSFLCVLFGGVSPWGYALAYLAIPLPALMFGALAVMLSAQPFQSNAEAKQQNPGAAIIAPFFFLVWFSSVFVSRGGPALIGIANGVAGAATCVVPIHVLWAAGTDNVLTYQVPLFNFMVSGVVLHFAVTAVALFFALAAAARRMHSDTIALWSRPQVFALAASVAILFAGILANTASAPAASRETWLGGLLIPAHLFMVMIAMVTAPNRYRYRAGLRARLAGEAQPNTLLDERGLGVAPTLVCALMIASAFLGTWYWLSVRSAMPAEPVRVALFMAHFLACAALYTFAAHVCRFLFTKKQVTSYIGVLFAYATPTAIAGFLGNVPLSEGARATLRALAFCGPFGPSIEIFARGMGGALGSPAFFVGPIVIGLIAAFLGKIVGAHCRVLKRSLGVAQIADNARKA